MAATPRKNTPANAAASTGVQWFKPLDAQRISEQRVEVLPLRRRANALLYAYLLARKFTNPQGVAFTTYEKLGAVTGATIPTMQRALNSLVEAGLIVKRRGFNGQAYCWTDVVRPPAGFIASCDDPQNPHSRGRSPGSRPRRTLRVGEAHDAQLSMPWALAASIAVEEYAAARFRRWGRAPGRAPKAELAQELGELVVVAAEHQAGEATPASMREAARLLWLTWMGWSGKRGYLVDDQNQHPIHVVGRDLAELESVLLAPGRKHRGDAAAAKRPAVRSAPADQIATAREGARTLRRALGGAR